MNVCITYLNWVVHCCLAVPTVHHRVLRLPMHKRLAFHDRIQLWWKSHRFADWSRKILCLRCVANRRYNNRPVRRETEIKMKKTLNWIDRQLDWTEPPTAHTVRASVKNIKIDSISLWHLIVSKLLAIRKYKMLNTPPLNATINISIIGKSWTWRIQHICTEFSN